MIQLHTDILIIGGGIAGCIAAISLSEHFHVSLIDKLAEPKDRIGESLAPAARRIFDELDLLKDLSSEEENNLFRENLGMQSYWGSEQVQIVDHLNNPDGLGINLDRREFEVYLRQKAIEKGVNCYWSTQLLKSELSEEKWVIQTRNGKETKKICAEYVIDATGRQSHFCRQIGIERTAYDKLIACWISLPNTLENKLSTISTTKNGWWYSSVLPNNKRVIAFQTDSDLISKSAFRTLESFLELSTESKEISENLKNSELDKIEFHGVTSANSTRLNEVNGKNWAAIGDAAISFDPLSSQGMFNAMACAMQLRDLLLEFGFSDKTEELYSAQIDSIWYYYIQHKNLYYNQEKRWRNSEFWKRRQ